MSDSAVPNKSFPRCQTRKAFDSGVAAANSKTKDRNGTEENSRKKRGLAVTQFSEAEQRGQGNRNASTDVTKGRMSPPTKTRRTMQTSKRLSEEGPSNKIVNGAVLCIKANTIPDLYIKLVNSLSQDEKICLRTYDVQTDIINLATEEKFFLKKNPEESILDEILGKIRDEGAYLNLLPKEEDNSSAQLNDVLARYDAFHHSASEVEKRQFMRGKHKWTEEEKKRYAEAFVKYSRDQKGNKRIAEYVGNGVSPQQCTEYRNILKKNGQLDALKAKAIQYAQEMALKRKKKAKV